MKKLITLLLAMASFASVHATIRYVKQVASGNGSGNGSGADWANANSDIQAMINASTEGDEVWVCAGNYKPNRPADNTGTLSPGNRGNAFVLKKNVKIYGGFSGNESALSGRNLADSANASRLDVDFNDDDAGGFANYVENAFHVVVSAGEVGTATLDGFVISGGCAVTGGSIMVNGLAVSSEFGGGIACVASSPLLANLTVKQNIAISGGGIGCNNSAPRIYSCLIAANIAITNGGGISNAAASLPTITGCRIATNRSGRAGGGIFHTDGGKLMLDNNILQYNYSNIGGAVRMLGGDPNFTATGNTFYNNGSYTNDAGAVSLVMGNGKDTLINNLFAFNIANTQEGEGENGGGAMVQEGGSSSLIANNTFFFNRADANSGGIRFKAGGSNRYLYNNIFYKNYVGTSDADVSLENGTTIAGEASNSYGNTDPLFVNMLNLEGADNLFGTADDGLRLQTCSPAVNAGLNAALPASITTDIASAARIYNNAIVDRGAYEFEGYPLSAIITAAPVCIGSVGTASVPFAGAGVSYKWIISNGTITGAANGNRISYNSGDSGLVTLSVTVVPPPFSSCTQQEGSKLVNIVKAVANITTERYTCSQSTGSTAWVANAGAGAHYNWAIANGAITGNADSSSIVYKADTAGLATLTVAVTNVDGCTATGTATVRVDAKPPLPEIITNEFVCPGTTGLAATVRDLGTTVSYEWTISGGQFTSASNIRDITYDAGTSGAVQLYVTVGKCSLFTTSNTATVYIRTPPDAVIQTSATACALSTGNVAFVYETAPGSTYNWTIANGTITDGLGTGRITYTAGASGSVSLGVVGTNSAQCSSSGSTVVGLTVAPKVPITTAGLVCAGATGIRAWVPDYGPSTQYSWTVDNGERTGGNGTEIYFTAGGVGATTVTVNTSSVFACPATGTVSIPVDDGRNWLEKANLPTARQGALGFSFFNNGYIGLGKDANGNILNDLWQYNTQSNSWNRMTRYPGRNATCVVSILDIPFIGPDLVTNTIWGYNPNSDQWVEWNYFEPAIRDGDPVTSIISAQGFSINDMGYYYMKISRDGLPAVMEFWQFNYRDRFNAWTRKAAFPGKERQGLTAFGIGNSGYMGMGIDSAGITREDIWEYNPDLDTWIQKANFGGGPRSGATCFTMGNKAYVGTGMSTTKKNDFWIYDPGADTWTRTIDFVGVPRTNAASFSVNGKGYVGTGNTSGVAADFYEYNTQGTKLLIGAVDSRFCAGASFRLPYYRGCVAFNEGNVFTAQLSDSLGNFANPLAIGRTSGTGSDTINVTIPKVAGTKFRIRVVSSSPATNWANNGTDITIIRPVVGFTASPSRLVCGATAVTLAGTGATTYAWSGGIANNTPFTLSQSYAYTVVGTDAFGCTDTAVASTTVHPLPNGSLAGNAICLGEIGQFTFTADSGRAPFSLRIKDTLYTGVQSDIPFNVWLNPSNTTAYKLLSVADSNGCRRDSGFTNANAVITKVLSKLAIDKDVATAYLQSDLEELAAEGASCRVLAQVMPQGANPVAGNLTAKVWVDSTVQSFTYQGYALPYVQRHYDIAPEDNATNATAQLTLYFSQQEFDAFNTKTGNPALSLPTGPADVQGKNRLRVYQLHGESAGGLGTPESYTGSATVIQPTDGNIVWNNTLRRWEITFAVDGFSGFFAGANLLGALPVKLISFSAALGSGNKAANLQWEVAGQQGIQSYLVEKSADGNSFQGIGSVAANQLSSSTYTYTDPLPPASSLLTVYYRLKIVDANGRTTYSHIVRLNTASLLATKIMLYPNPVAKGGVLQINVGNGVLRRYKLTTAAGHTLLQKDGLRTTGNTSLQLPATLASGVYYLQLQTDEGISNERVIVR